MIVDNQINNRILDILKKILGMAENPSVLSEYITREMHDLVGSETVVLIVHNENTPEHTHEIIGIHPETKKESLDLELIERIAEASHEIHSTQLVYHNNNDTLLEQVLSTSVGIVSIVVPLEYSGNRVGAMLLLNIPEDQDLNSMIEPLDALSAVLALEFRNANLFQNLELTVANRTRQVLESEKRFRTIIEQATDAMYIIDFEGNVTDTNLLACKTLGYSREELLKLNICDFDIFHKSPERVKDFTHVYLPDNTNTFESIHRKKNGETFPVELSNSLVQLEGKNFIVSFVRDITNRKIAEEQIFRLNEELEKKVNERTREIQVKTDELIDNQKALLNLVEDINEKSEELTRKTEELQITNKELETYSYSVSHDLRAPLRAVNGFIKILKNDYSDKFDDEGKRICKIIETNAAKMGKLIDDLLAFSRLGRSEIRRRNVDMSQLVKQIIEEFNLKAANRKIDIKIEKLPNAICDPNLIRQVWINLVSNAVKYSSLNESASIEIGAESTENETIYFIKDNGIGFDMNYAHKLFGVFQRLHNRIEFEGNGVGLAIVQQIIQKHGGKVWAEGTIGKGAIFYFSMPKHFSNLN